MKNTKRAELIRQLRIAAKGPSFVSRKYGASIRAQLRYLKSLPDA
jgi:hypothetical protein